ncbi:MFS transporter [Streptomyces sp. NPDC021020]|uniref:MFS transporter n=1 Tax=Streptomyces sp. NPDC021020 TaxID=3365109 RepID=UPI0037929B33
MSETLASGDAVTKGEAGPDPKRWWALAVIALATLIVVLDATIVNVALPHAQSDLDISDANRQWVLTAYTLPFGGLLLLGGRIADFNGRRRALLVGLVGFAAASALGGAAVDQGMLYTARALQGVFAALLAPAALSLLNVTFTDPRERATAFGVYGGVLGGGSAVGLLAGGLLTNYLDWRWCLYVNVPIAAAAFIGALPLIKESRASGQTRYDVPGAVLVSIGLALAVYGFAEAADDGWGSGKSYGALIGGAVLVAVFAATQARGRHPLLPPRVVADRNRTGAFLGSLLIFMAMMGMFLFMTYYLQGVLGYSALKTGVAILPLTLVIMVGSGVVTGLMRVVPPRLIISASFLICAVALVWFSRIEVDSSFAGHVLGPECVVGLGMAGILVPTANLALLGVGGQDAGVASGLVNAAQQVGGSIGVALLNTVAADATSRYITAHHGSGPVGEVMAKGAVHGYSIGFLVSAAIFAVGALASAVLIHASTEETVGANMAAV